MHLRIYCRSQRILYSIYNIALKVPELMERVPMLKTVYEEAFTLAAAEDREKTSDYYRPRIGAI